MRKMWKKALSLTSALMLTVTPMISDAESIADKFAASGFEVTVMTDGRITGRCGENLAFIFDEATGSLIIVGTGAMYNFSEGKAPWSAVASQIIQVIVSEGVVSIGDYAFSDCTEMVAVTIPASLEAIGEEAFSGCDAVATVSFVGSAEAWEATESLLVDAGVVAAEDTGAVTMMSEMPQEYMAAVNDAALMAIVETIVDSVKTNGEEQRVTIIPTVSPVSTPIPAATPYPTARPTAEPEYEEDLFVPLQTGTPTTAPTAQTTEKSGNMPPLDKGYKYTYDENGKITGATGNDSTIVYLYDDEGNVVASMGTSTLSEGWWTEEYIYDENGKLIASNGTFPYGTNKVEYDENEQPTYVEFTDLKGELSITTNTYDQKGNLTLVEVYASDGTLIRTGTHTYDENGNKISTVFKYADGRVTEIWYDKEGNVIDTPVTGDIGTPTAAPTKPESTQKPGIVPAIDPWMEYTYDENGKITGAAGTLDDCTTTLIYEFDNHGNVVTVHGSSDRGGDWVENYGYNENGKQTLYEMIYPNGNTYRETKVFDETNKLLSSTTKYEDDTLEETKYKYDEEGNLVSSRLETTNIPDNDFGYASVSFSDSKYKNGNVISSITVMTNGVVIEVNSEYDESGRIKSSVTKQNGIWGDSVETKEYYYNENGKMESIKRTNADGSQYLDHIDENGVMTYREILANPTTPTPTATFEPTATPIPNVTPTPTPEPEATPTSNIASQTDI